MTRPIVFGAVAIVLFALGVIAANTQIAHGWIPVTAYEADVNKDTRVNSGDLGAVASKFGQPVPTATPTAVRPPIVGNRAFGSNYGGTLPYQLFNTDDGSIVKTFPVGDAPAGGNAASCDGAYSMLTQIAPPNGQLQPYIIRTLDGSTVVQDPTAYNAPFVRFTCPLLGLGGQFNSGSPVAHRAIVRGEVFGIGPRVSIFNLITGQRLYTTNDTQGNFNLNCSENTVAITNYAGDTLTIVRLSDGGIVTSIPETGFRAACGW